ncbi:unnamed protein product [Adineta ricciae]|uniref:Uncharacterized protein n=1 Tax=Adineta ricciae TaxID=249248 RepID=A0A814IGP7_ADIRI|nr:unnamed protein product [Adineta ricciae]CAF1064784.1 unnamed protein product [Adineta ricciae]
MFTSPVSQWSKAEHFRTLSTLRHTDDPTICSARFSTRHSQIPSCTYVTSPSISANENVSTETKHPSFHPSLEKPYDTGMCSTDGDIKQKLTLEIWLPNTQPHNDDENVDQTTSTTKIDVVETLPILTNPVQSKPPVASHQERTSCYPTISSSYNEETNTFKIVEKLVPSNPSPVVTPRSNSSKPISSFLRKYSSMRKANPPPMMNNSKLIQLPILPGKAPIHVSRPSSVIRQANTSTTFLARCPSSINWSRTDVHPQLRVFSLTNQQPSSIFLTSPSNKKTNETLHPLRRSRTFETLFDYSTSVRIPSFSETLVNPILSLTSKRMSFTFRSKQ